MAVESVLSGGMNPVGVLDRRALNQLVNLYCVFLIPDGDAKRHKVLYWFRQWVPYV